MGRQSGANSLVEPQFLGGRCLLGPTLWIRNAKNEELLRRGITPNRVFRILEPCQILRYTLSILENVEWSADFKHH